MTLAERLPQPLRRAKGRLRAAFVRVEVVAELRRIARTGRPVIAGPWLGEVGFEVLYWIPFLRWVINECEIASSRVIAVSRGGPSSWYAGIADRYVDVFDHLSVQQFRTGNDNRRLEIGEQKQVREAAFDREILAIVRDAEDLADAEVVHPALMYRLFQPYWWKHAGTNWVARHTMAQPLIAPSLPVSLNVTPREYFAVKFYFNDCVTDSDRTRRFAADTVSRLSEIAPVVSLSTDLALDDHGSATAATMPRVTSVSSHVSPQNNLAIQTAVLANARAFVGTYGGFSYVPAFHRVATHSVYSVPRGFDRAHLVMAQDAFVRIGAPPLHVIDMNETTAEQVADAVASVSA